MEWDSHHCTPHPPESNGQGETQHPREKEVLCSPRGKAEEARSKLSWVHVFWDLCTAFCNIHFHELLENLSYTLRFHLFTDLQMRSMWLMTCRTPCLRRFISHYHLDLQANSTSATKSASPLDVGISGKDSTITGSLKTSFIIASPIILILMRSSFPRQFLLASTQLFVFNSRLHDRKRNNLSHSNLYLYPF